MAGDGHSWLIMRYDIVPEFSRLFLNIAPVKEMMISSSWVWVLWICAEFTAGFSSLDEKYSEIHNQYHPKSSLASTAMNISEQTKGLRSLYNTFRGPHWRNKSKWMSTIPACQWHGVSCDGDLVTKVDLGSNNLRGDLDDLPLTFYQQLEGLTEISFEENHIGGKFCND